MPPKALSNWIYSEKDFQVIASIIADSAAQENDLLLYLQISETFWNWTSVHKKYNVIESYPNIVLNGYKSRETNYQWNHFDGTQLEYFGLHDDDQPSLDLVFSTFVKAKVLG